MIDILELLKFTVESGASDLHLNAGSPPMVRVDGEMRKIDVPDLLPDDIHRLIYDIMTDEDRKRFEEKWELDFSRAIGDMGRFRVNVYYQNHGKAAVFRTIPNKILTLEELNLPDVIRKFCDLDKGMVLVTGPTGSGKSTTLAAMVDYINRKRRCHIITIEDPIEFVHESRTCLISQREVGRDTHSFSNALLAKTVDRIVDVFPTTQQAQIRSMFADSVAGVVAQILLKRREGHGRAAALEIMVATNAVRALLRENKTYQIQSALQTGSSVGMRTMEQAIRQLFQQQLISREAALEHIDDKSLN